MQSVDIPILTIPTPLSTRHDIFWKLPDHLENVAICSFAILCHVGCSLCVGLPNQPGTPWHMGWKSDHERKWRRVARSLRPMDRCDRRSKKIIWTSHLSTTNRSCCSPQQQLCSAFGGWDGWGLQVDSCVLLWDSQTNPNHHPLCVPVVWFSHPWRRCGIWREPKGEMAPGLVAKKCQLSKRTPFFNAQDPQSSCCFHESLRCGIHWLPKWSGQYLHAQILSTCKGNCWRNEGLRTWKFHLYNSSMADATLPGMSLCRRSQWFLFSQESEQQFWATPEMSIRRGAEEFLLSCKVGRDRMECCALQHPTWEFVAGAVSCSLRPHSPNGSALWTLKGDSNSHHEHPRCDLRHPSGAATFGFVQHHGPHHWIQRSRLPSTGLGTGEVRIWVGSMTSRSISWFHLLIQLIDAVCVSALGLKKGLQLAWFSNALPIPKTPLLVETDAGTQAPSVGIQAASMCTTMYHKNFYMEVHQVSICTFWHSEWLNQDRISCETKVLYIWRYWRAQVWCVRMVFCYVLRVQNLELCDSDVYKVDDATKTDIVVAYHPYGYGGYGLKDCAEAPNGVALCTEFRTDNTGPPSNVSEVMGILNSVKKEYPGAEVIASTFDAFFEEVQEVRQKLPTVSLEVGDTWVYGNPSDPLKMAQYRAIQRAWIKCLQSHEPRCQPSDPAIQNMTFFLLKAPEHTWGTPGISGWGGGDDYNTSKFRRDLSNLTFMKAAASWAEQRIFNELAARALEVSDVSEVSDGSHPLAKLVREELNMVENVEEPQTTKLKEIPLGSTVTFSSGTRIKLGSDGSIVSLQFRSEDLASPEAPFGGFSYQTFNDTEWKPFTYASWKQAVLNNLKQHEATRGMHSVTVFFIVFLASITRISSLLYSIPSKAYLNDHQMQTGFCKPGSNNFTESATWRPTMHRLFVQNSSFSEFLLAEMQMPQKPSSSYGAPSRIYLNISASTSGLDLTFTTIGKLPTMVAESSSISFVPREGSGWRLMKLGQEIDPEGVLDGGNQFTHGVWGGVSVRTAHGVLTLDSLDAINVNPITEEYPVGNPLPASYMESTAKAGKGLSRLAAGSIKGMAVNLHNNLWNTNYPLYYPYFDARFCETPLKCKNSNSLFRFHLEYKATTATQPTQMYVWSSRSLDFPCDSFESAVAGGMVMHFAK